MIHTLRFPVSFRRSFWPAAGICLVPLALASPARAQSNLLVNGGFENGLTGWSVSNRITGDKYDASDPQAAQGSYYAASYADSRPQEAGTQFTAPISQLYSTPDTSALIGQGSGFAVSDMNAVGSHALYQSFTATASTLQVRWSQFVYDWAGFDPAQASANNQYARVDLLLSSAIASDPFTGTVTSVLYGPGVDVEASQGENPRWRNYGATVTGLTAGQSYALRFQTVDSQFPLNHAVDNAGVFAIPEPGTAPLVALPVVGFAVLVCRRARRKAGAVS